MHDRNPIGKISNVDDTRGAFPNIEDVAVIGRGREDVILKYNSSTKASEVDLRAGIRGETTNSDNKDMIGNIIFNGTDPAYIQLKYKAGLAKNQNHQVSSMINMVADKINIISNQDENKFKLTDIDQLINESELDSIMEKLHRLAHGDTLVELLKLIIKAILTHVHPYAGMPPCVEGYVQEMAKYEVEKIMSKHVRIS